MDRQPDSDAYEPIGHKDGCAKITVLLERVERGVLTTRLIYVILYGSAQNALYVPC